MKTFHTFSFADYQEGGFESYGALRVINEGEWRPIVGSHERGDGTSELIVALLLQFLFGLPFLLLL